MKKDYRVVIVGGGLAGLTCAIHLSRTGFPVALIDKNTYPRHKVCGEYVSDEVKPYLTWLGLDVESLNPSQISKIEFSAGHQSVHAKLPLGGFGVSRYAFDYLMYKKMISQNCEFIVAQVDDIKFADDEFTLTLSDNTQIKAEITIGAFGKRSNIDQKMNRSFILKKSPWLAVKSHYSGDFPDDVVGLHNFKGGYCGVSKVENNVINICYLADFKTFKQFKNIQDYQDHVVSKNPLLKKVFENVATLFDKPLTISQISFDKKRCVENHVLMAGDSAGLIHPFCGNGMALAIRSAKLLSELIDKFLTGEIENRKLLEQRYELEWKSNFSGRLKTGRILSKLMRNAAISGILMRGFAKFPSALTGIIKLTHGKMMIVNP